MEPLPAPGGAKAVSSKAPQLNVEMVKLTLSPPLGCSGEYERVSACSPPKLTKASIAEKTTRRSILNPPGERKLHIALQHISSGGASPHASLDARPWTARVHAMLSPPGRALCPLPPPTASAAAAISLPSRGPLT